MEDHDLSASDFRPTLEKPSLYYSILILAAASGIERIHLENWLHGAASTACSLSSWGEQVVHTALHSLLNPQGPWETQHKTKVALSIIRQDQSPYGQAELPVIFPCNELSYRLYIKSFVYLTGNFFKI